MTQERFFALVVRSRKLAFACFAFAPYNPLREGPQATMPQFDSPPHGKTERHSMQRRRESAIPAAHSLRTVDLAFHVFERSIHPELFSLRQGVVLERGALQARLYLTSTGHVCSYAWGKSTLTETLCSTSQTLPRRRQRIERKLKDGSFDGQVPVVEERALIGGAGYSLSLSVRACGPAEFVELQQEALDAPPPQLIDAGERPDRWNGLRSLSWIRYELSAKALEVRSFRTLPSDYAVVETTSRFVLPGA